MGRIFDAYLSTLRLWETCRTNPSLIPKIRDTIRKNHLHLSGLVHPYTLRFPPALTFTTTPNFRYEFISPRIYQVHGYTVMELIADPFLALEYLAPDRDAYFDALDTGRYHSPQTWRIRQKDGGLSSFREFRVAGEKKQATQLIFEPVARRIWQVGEDFGCVHRRTCRLRGLCGGPVRCEEIRAA